MLEGLLKQSYTVFAQITYLFYETIVYSERRGCRSLVETSTKLRHLRGRSLVEVWSKFGRSRIHFEPHFGHVYYRVYV